MTRTRVLLSLLVPVLAGPGCSDGAPEIESIELSCSTKADETGSVLTVVGQGTNWNKLSLHVTDPGRHAPSAAAGAEAAALAGEWDEAVMPAWPARQPSEAPLGVSAAQEVVQLPLDMWRQATIVRRA